MRSKIGRPEEGRSKNSKQHTTVSLFHVIVAGTLSLPTGKLEGETQTDAVCSLSGMMRNTQMVGD
jgi:hypothetical protein